MATPVISAHTNLSVTKNTILMFVHLDTHYPVIHDAPVVVMKNLPSLD